MSWEIVRLGDCCVKIGSGATPKGGSTVYVENGTSLIRSQNVYNLSFEYDGLTHVTDEAAQKLSGVTVCPDDILLNITGDSVARVCMVPLEVLPARVNQHVAIIRTGKNVLPQYLLYYLASPHMQAYMLNLAVGKGASRNALTKGMIEDFPLPLPPVGEQQRIIEILSPYCDLIENNKKQIKLLEEAAQRLYKEWFVDLRFPGHETTPITDGIPEGWVNCAVSDFGEIVTGKTPSTVQSEYYGGNIPFVKIPDMHGRVFPIKTEVCLTKEGAETQKNKYIPRNSIMVSCIATVGLVNIAVEECQTNQQINSVILHNERDLYFLYFALKQMKSLLDGVGSNGATMTNVNKAKFGRISVVCPSEALRTGFYEWCEPVFRKIETLSKNIVLLQEARDSLLPKLMNGKIEVN